MQVLFIASFSPIVRDVDTARRFYRDALGLRLEGGEGDYAFTERLDGVKHFGLWPLAEAANSCFGTGSWPDNVPVPQASVEFEVDDVAAAADELEQRGYTLLHPARTEPWNQVTARLLGPDGLLVAVCHTPWLRSADTAVRTAFWEAVDVADQVLTSTPLPRRWGEPSALDQMSVGDVAAHLVRAVTNVVTYLSRPAPGGQPIAPAAYYAAVLDDDPADLGSSPNQGVRQRARRDAEAGAEQVLANWRQALTSAHDRLADTPSHRRVGVALDLVLTIDNYLATRVVELVVHADDLAVSLGIDPPPTPTTAAEVAERVLLDIARHRHGDTAVLRALTRRERSSASALQVL